MKTRLCALTLVIGLSAMPFLAQATTHHHHTGAVKKSAPAATHPAAEKKTEASGAEKSKPQETVSYTEVEPLNLLKDPDTWVGKDVSFSANFVSFSPYALDYKGAMRTSKDYIAFLIQRPDAPQHVIPLSEMKLIYPRKKVDKVMDLENGDKVEVKGKVFSAALGDPWLDVDSVTILQKNPANANKAKKKAKKHDIE